MERFRIKTKLNTILEELAHNSLVIVKIKLMKLKAQDLAKCFYLNWYFSVFNALVLQLTKWL